MLDRHLVPLLKPPLGALAARLDRLGVSADAVTVAGFVAGLCATVAVAFDAYLAGLALLLVGRLADGVDGELARRVRARRDTGAWDDGDAGGGAFLDITLDFVFYAVFPLGFAFADPASNALPAAVLIASFVGTGASFLAFAAQADRRGIRHPDFGYKGLYYLDGLAEGSETIIAFALMCLFPSAFAPIAWAFAALCVLTAVNRIVAGHRSLR